MAKLVLLLAAQVLVGLALLVMLMMGGAATIVKASEDDDDELSFFLEGSAGQFVPMHFAGFSDMNWLVRKYLPPGTVTDLSLG